MRLLIATVVLLSSASVALCQLPDCGEHNATLAKGTAEQYRAQCVTAKAECDNAKEVAVEVMEEAADLRELIVAIGGYAEGALDDGDANMTNGIGDANLAQDHYDDAAGTPTKPWDMATTQYNTGVGAFQAGYNAKYGNPPNYGLAVTNYGNADTQYSACQGNYNAAKADFMSSDHDWVQAEVDFAYAVEEYNDVLQSLED
jgi:hypothetical protein